MATGFHGIWCDECGVEITWTPVVIDHRTYCCHDCAVGLECDCEQLEPPWAEEVDFFWTEGIEQGSELISGADYGFE